jgi:hypothetical protein
MFRSRLFLGLHLGIAACVVLTACAKATSSAPPASAESEPVAASSAATGEREGQPAASEGSEVAPDASVPTKPATDAPSAEASQPLPKGTRVLQIGDSFADALGGTLSKLLRAVEVKSDLEFETPSYIPNWSYGSKLPKLLTTYHPDLVLITLGANEIEIPHPEERAKPIRHLVETLAGRPCVWIAPPLWKPDSGVLEVIRNNVAPCRYLDSNRFVHDLPRARDKIHPSTEGREIWAKVVFDWLVRERVGTPTRPWELKPGAEAGSAEAGRVQQPPR